jgi:glycerate 2-kinase
MIREGSHSVILDLFCKAVEAVDPYRAVCAGRDRIIATLKRDNLRRIFIAGFGKASVPMAKAVIECAGDAVEKGVLITKYGHAGSERFPENIRVFEAGHPVPDANGYFATQEIIAMLRETDESTLVVFLISGGGSALLTCPPKGISLEEKQTVTDLLLRSGANIHELNTVRKHISAVKGGRLAEMASPAHSLSLILSDVIGDSEDAIASGPASSDPTTYAQARTIIDKYDLTGKMPLSVIKHLARGLRGDIPETPKPGSPVFLKSENIIVANNILAIDAASKSAQKAGWRAEILSTDMSGEACGAAKYLAAMVRERLHTMRSGEKVCLVAGGETTVTVTGGGKGGRNTEMALAFGIEMQGEEGVVFLSAGTDGQDGPTDAAGAIVDGLMVSEALRNGLDPEHYLRRNDSYTFFSKTGGLIKTGPTGTNVMDIQLILLEK